MNTLQVKGKVSKGKPAGKSVVYSRRENAPPEIGKILLSLTQAALQLNATRITISKWLYQGLLMPHDSPSIGNRTFHYFLPEYIAAVAYILKKHTETGVPKVTPEDRAAVEKINKKFYPHRSK